MVSICSPEMPRRAFMAVIAGGLLAPPLAAEGQSAGKVYRIGWLGTAPPAEPLSNAFVEGMRERGLVEGQNFALERRFSEGRNDRLPGLATELVERKPDLLVSVGTPPTAAAKHATTTIPIVFTAVGDPLGSGFVASLARPGANVTGLGGLGGGMHVKMLELLKEAVPKASRIAVLANSTLPMHGTYRDAIEPVARSAGASLRLLELRVPEDIEIAFAAITRDKVDALMILGQPIAFVHRVRIANLALDHRVPAISVFGEAAEAGTLLAFGDRLVDYMRRLPYYVDRILKGAKPADMPVEQSTKFYLSKKSQNRQGARPHDPAIAPAAGGSGDRIATEMPGLLAALDARLRRQDHDLWWSPRRRPTLSPLGRSQRRPELVDCTDGNPPRGRPMVGYVAPGRAKP